MAPSPVMTWLLLVHWKLLLGQPAYCVSGTFLASGKFCLTSAAFGGSDDELPVLEVVVVSCGTWAPMASLLEELWAEAAWPSPEEGLPDCLNLAPEDVDNDARSPSEMHQICAVERFQKALYLRALAALHCEDPGPELFFGTKSGSAQGRSWKVRRQAAPGTELEEIPTVDLRQVLEEQAVEDARQAFKEAATPEGYARLLRLSFANARKLAGLLDAVD